MNRRGFFRKVAGALMAPTALSTLGSEDQSLDLKATFCGQIAEIDIKYHCGGVVKRPYQARLCYAPENAFFVITPAPAGITPLNRAKQIIDELYLRGTVSFGNPSPNSLLHVKSSKDGQCP